MPIKNKTVLDSYKNSQYKLDQYIGKVANTILKQLDYLDCYDPDNLLDAADPGGRLSGVAEAVVVRVVTSCHTKGQEFKNKFFEKGRIFKF